LLLIEGEGRWKEERELSGEKRFKSDRREEEF
jgi:hypothetical protein